MCKLFCLVWFILWVFVVGGGIIVLFLFVSFRPLFFPQLKSSLKGSSQEKMPYQMVLYTLNRPAVKSLVNGKEIFSYQKKRLNYGKTF